MHGIDRVQTSDLDFRRKESYLLTSCREHSNIRVDNVKLNSPFSINEKPPCLDFQFDIPQLSISYNLTIFIQCDMGITPVAFHNCE